MISGEVFDHFKPNAIFVNTARGGIVNEDDLYDALVQGKLRAAAFDVFAVEPLPADSKLLTLNNFSATPHSGGNTEEALARTSMAVVENVIHVIKGEPAEGIVVLDKICLMGGNKMFSTVFTDLGLLMVFLLVGVAIREIIKPIQKLFIPASVLGGAVALILGPQVLGLIEIPETFAEMPSPMITVVLTAMILGTKFSGSKFKEYASTTAVEGAIYFGQMTIGLAVGMLLGKVWHALPDHWGILSVYAFFGGHGAATSAGQIYEDAGLEGSLSLAVILATLGLMLAIIVGMIIINIGVRKGWATVVNKDAQDPWFFGGIIPEGKRNSIGEERLSASGINALALQLALIMLSIFIGNAIFVPLGNVFPVISQFPGFLYGMVGAAIVWFVMCKTHTDQYYDHKTVSGISGLALEICVTAAVATLNVGLMKTFILPIIILSIVVIGFTIIVCFFFGRRWLKKDWFETMCTVFGQCLGSATTGLALGRCVDPDGRTSAFDSFGVASSIMAPLAAVLVAVMPLLSLKSDATVLAIGAAVTVAIILFGEFVLRKGKE